MLIEILNHQSSRRVLVSIRVIDTIYEGNESEKYMGHRSTVYLRDGSCINSSNTIDELKQLIKEAKES